MEDQEAGHFSNWKNAVLIRDFDLVYAGIKIILALPANSKTISKLGKTIYAALNDVEAILLRNQIPIKRLAEIPQPSQLCKEEEHTGSTTSLWRRSVLARNLDLVHTCVHAILLELPKKDKIQLGESAFAALKDLQDVILKDDSCCQQIVHYNHDDYKLKDFDCDEVPKKSFDESTHQNVEVLQKLTVNQPQIESQLQYYLEDHSPLEEPQNDVRPAKTTTPRKQYKLTNIVEPVRSCNFSVENELQNHVQIQNLSSVPSHVHDKEVPGSQVRESSMCSICNCCLTRDKCMSCTNFALKMEQSMKQNVFYECCHEDNSGGVNCQVCRFNLILIHMPNYAKEKKIHVIHKQAEPVKLVRKENPEVKTQQHNKQIGTHTTGMIELNGPSRSVDETSSAVNFEIPTISLSDDELEAPILITNVTSLTVARGVVESQNVGVAPKSKAVYSSIEKCVVCDSHLTLGGKCRACAVFLQRIASIMKDGAWYECPHMNFSGGSKCRVCRYNKILQLNKDHEQKKL